MQLADQNIFTSLVSVRWLGTLETATLLWLAKKRSRMRRSSLLDGYTFGVSCEDLCRLQIFNYVAKLGKLLKEFLNKLGENRQFQRRISAISGGDDFCICLQRHSSNFAPKPRFPKFREMQIFRWKTLRPHFSAGYLPYPELISRWYQDFNHPRSGNLGDRAFAILSTFWVSLSYVVFSPSGVNNSKDKQEIILGIDDWAIYPISSIFQFSVEIFAFFIFFFLLFTFPRNVLVT